MRPVAFTHDGAFCRWGGYCEPVACRDVGDSGETWQNTLEPVHRCYTAPTMLAFFLLSFVMVIGVSVVAAILKRRWRPRFTLGTFAIFVTLVCVYFAAWEATKTFGVPSVSERFDMAEWELYAIAPCIVYSNQTRWYVGDPQIVQPHHDLFIWCDLVYKLPFEWNEPDKEVDDDDLSS